MGLFDKIASNVARRVNPKLARPTIQAFESVEQASARASTKIAERSATATDLVSDISIEVASTEDREAREAKFAEQTLLQDDQQSQVLQSEAPAEEPSGILYTVAKGFAAVINFEQELTKPLGKIPFPSFPALRVMDLELGWPHVHAHPPNLIPPAPPIPLTGPGMVIPIPFLSGASNTWINGRWAARAGDFGVCVWCGGYFPLFEVFFGSANVWIEMGRASRLLVDLTKHCIFSSPKPTDPPMGPTWGTTLSGSFNVLIGGIPIPSLFSLAIGPAFKALFKTLGYVGKLLSKAGRSIARKASDIGSRIADNFASRAARKTAARLALQRASAHIDDLLARGRLVLHGDDAFQKAARRDLRRLANTNSGRKLLDDLDRTGHHVDIRSPGNVAGKSVDDFTGPYAQPHDWGASRLQTVPDPDGPFSRIKFHKDANDVWHRTYDSTPGNRVHVRDTGAGSASDVVYDPSKATGSHLTSKQTPSDAILGHEMNHARNNALGQRANEISTTDPNFPSRWQDAEEFNTVGFENQYRAEQGLPHRNDYSVLPGYTP